MTANKYSIINLHQQFWGKTFPFKYICNATCYMFGLFVQWHWKRIIEEQRLRTYFDQKLILDVCSGQLKVLIDKKNKKDLKGITFESISDDSLNVYSISRYSCKRALLENGFKILSFRSLSK